MLAENWFNSTCPGVPPIDFSPLPLCVQSCIKDRTFDSGCITYQKICFCSRQSFSGCNFGCSGEDKTRIVDWYASVCGIPTASAEEVLAAETTAAGVIPPSSPWGGFFWYELFTLVVGVLSVAVFLAYVTFWRDHIQKQDRKRCPKRDQNGIESRRNPKFFSLFSHSSS